MPIRLQSCFPAFAGRWLPSLGWTCLGWLTCALAAGTAPHNDAQSGIRAEMRGWWVDAFHAGFRTPAEVRQLVADARQGHFNALFVQMRRRGDLFCASPLEPQATDVEPGFDPLAELLRLAHGTNAGPRLEIHAWVVAYPVWNQRESPPAQANHPFRLHPDWLTRAFDGRTWDGSNYNFDPGHPAVQEYLATLALDLVTRYDIDGLHWDYIRYPSREWGYNDTALAHFKTASGSAERPAPDDPLWLQWRRNQVTTLVRRSYLTLLAARPQLKLSAATITWVPGPATQGAWAASSAWSDVLQDWRGWMEEGILDLNIPMAYFRHEVNAGAWRDWSRFARESRFQRHVAVGVGTYLNQPFPALLQLRSALTASPPADGVVCYSYAVPVRAGNRGDFVRELTHTPRKPGALTAAFPRFVRPPEMPWKSDGSVAGIAGRVTNADTGEAVPGAEIQFHGPGWFDLTTDANGFFGRLCGLRGEGQLRVSAPGFESLDHPVNVTAGRIANLELPLRPAH